VNIEKFPVGAPPKYSSPEKMEKKIAEYFEYVKEKHMVPTVPGLALFLGMTTKRLSVYRKKKKFEEIIEKAYDFIADIYVRELLRQKISAPGAIFVLKNLGWKDESEKKVTVEGKMEVESHVYLIPSFETFRKSEKKKRGRPRKLENVEAGPETAIPEISGMKEAGEEEAEVSGVMVVEAGGVEK